MEHTIERPKGSRVSVARTPSRLIIDIPNREAQPRAMKEATMVAGLALFGFALWARGLETSNQFGLIAVYICVATALWLLAKMLHRLIGETQIRLSDTTLSIVRKLFGVGVTVSSRRGALRAAQLEPASLDNTVDDPEELVLDDGVRVHRFGRSLSRPERTWVAHEINSFLEDAKSSDAA